MRRAWWCVFLYALVMTVIAMAHHSMISTVVDALDVICLYYAYPPSSQRFTRRRRRRR